MGPRGLGCGQGGQYVASILDFFLLIFQLFLAIFESIQKKR